LVLTLLNIKNNQKITKGLAFYESKLDVITTSGVKTGAAPSLYKIQQISQVATKPIAIASGISIDNVKQFKPYVRDFLVGTSIGYHNLILEKMYRIERSYT